MLSEDLEWMRRHPFRVLVIALAVAALVAFVVWAASTAYATYDRLEQSPWSQQSGKSDYNLDEPDPQRGHPEAQYDVSQKGVVLPPSRDERLAGEGRSPEDAAADGDQEYPKTCQDRPRDIETSDLCAQWYSVAAARHGNRIASENFKIASLAALLSGLGLMMTGLAVVIAALAARDAGRAVRLMREGMQPLLTVRPSSNAPAPGIKILNAGTGVARDIEITINGQATAMRCRVLQAGEECLVPKGAIRPGDTMLVVDLRYASGSGESVEHTEKFAFADGRWLQEV